MTFWPAVSQNRRTIYGGLILTSPTVVVKFSPEPWRIYINFANGGCKILTCRPKELTDDTWRIYNNFANGGREFWPLAYRMYTNFANVGLKFRLATLRIYINFANNDRLFLTCCHNHWRMTHGRNISTALKLFVNFWPATRRIYNNFAKIGRKLLTCRPQTSADEIRRMNINNANVGHEFFDLQLLSIGGYQKKNVY